MSTETIQLTEAVRRYLAEQTVREPGFLRELRAETAKLDNGHMQIAPEQGQFMALLAQMLGARRALEVGVFTGYSSTCVALALPADGELVACDVSEEYTAVARRYWERAGIADRVDLRIGPAVETLEALIAEGQSGSFDFAFIDADKDMYDRYYEQCLTLLRPGGVVALDNALRHGRVADASADDAATVAIRGLNAKIRDDERVSLSLVPIGDGVMLARKR